MTKQLYHRTSLLIRFILRRDRLRIPIWLISIAAVTWAVAIAFTDLYSSEMERQAMAETMKNPAMIAMVGPGYGLDDYTNGAMMAHQMLLFTAIAVGLMSILMVARHTRAEEEDGRIEMIRSLPVGRLSHLSAALIVVSVTNVFLALIVGVGLYSLGIESMDLEGSLLYGAALGATGLFFAALTAILAQLSESSRGAMGLAFSFLGLAYLVRAVGDVSNETLSWFSPFGWILGTEVFVNNIGWPIVLTIGISLILAILALFLNATRDLEAGFLPARAGRIHASPLLQKPLGLAFRIQRTAILAWAVGMIILGASYGSVLGDLESFFSNTELMQELLTPAAGFSLTEQFIALLMNIMATISTIPALMAMLKLYGEEKKNRTEHVLARPVSRLRLMGGYFFLSFVTAFVMQSLAAIGLWAAGAAVMEEGLSFGMIYQSAMVHTPAMWIMASTAVLLIGVAPRWSGLVWGYLLYSFMTVYLGGLLNFPDWLGKLSPYGHIPGLPVEEMNWLKVSVLTCIAGVLTAVGFVGYRKRDMQG